MTPQELFKIKEAKENYIKGENILYSFIYSAIDPKFEMYMGTLRIVYLNYRIDNNVTVHVGFYDGENEDEQYKTKILPFEAFESTETFLKEWNK